MRRFLCWRVRADRFCLAGPDFYPALGERLPRGTTIDITALREIRGITFEAEQIRIGGLTTWSEVIRTPLPHCFDALKAAAREVGSVQIQNRGTVAGNLCNASPAADGVPPLLALDAEVELASAAGTRRVPLAQFIAGNRKTLCRADEILAAVLVPRRIESAASTFLKLGARRYLVISISMVAVVLQSDDAGQVAESCMSRSDRAQRRRSDWGCWRRACWVSRRRPELVRWSGEEHLRSLSPIDDVRATAGYRRDVSLDLGASRS